ncbi:MFS transporter [Paraburkholderia sp. Ac-20342]|uniref:MFS transporter n=1 Tax=Paraburkholderia sp. Ac-20342 TaxID=2703889 RepID=UPI00197CD49B|nr:MFS transporter [Paraburkholderia sp. Ac-20342]MBN3846125.1 MFS transporter [Paraburkholderia sp. Ac-20342]
MVSTTFETSVLSLTPRQRILAMVALMSGVVLATLDTTISNTALPQIARELQSSEASIIWIANAYQIAMIAGLLPLASLGESIGYRRVYLFGLVVFVIASLVCGASSSLGWVIVGRVAQGVGAAAIMSVNTAFIRHIYPSAQLGRGLSLNALVVAVGFTLGPPLASGILSLANWHWLFLLNVPVGLIALPLAFRFLPDVCGTRNSLDAITGSLCAAFLGLLAFSFCTLANGMEKSVAICAAAVCALSLSLLLKNQARHPAPMLPVDLLKMPIIGLSSVTSVCAFATQALALVALPFFLQAVIGISVVNTGLLLSTWPLVVAAMALLVRPLSDRWSAGGLCSTGLLILCVGMMALASASSDTSIASIAFRLVLCGAGFGLYQAPNMKAIMSSAPVHRSGGASGIVAISRLMGQAAGAALVAQCFRISSQHGPELALWLGSGSAMVGLVFSALRLRTPARQLA